MRITTAMIGCLLAASSAGAQLCDGDFNNDGEVMINEIILTVNNSLNGCGDSSLVCPIDFSDDNTQDGTADCYYTGRWNLSCGAADLEMRWASDGEIVIIELLGFPDGLYLGAEVTSPTTADLIGWFTQLDLSDLDDLTGEVRLDGAQKVLVIDPDRVPFLVDDCKLSGYRGPLTDVVDPNATQAALRLGTRSQAFERLRATHAERTAPPNMTRP